MKNDTNMSQIKQYAIDTFNAEADAIRNLSNLLTDDFDQAVEAILVCTGKVVVTGMGKSGIIGKKIAATLASTGTPAFFLHPGEAYHGDLGMISKNDVVLAIANSGQTDEVLKLIPFMQNNGNTIIEADVPELEIYGYGTVLRSMTGGAGVFSYEFARYEQAPSDIQEKQIAARASKVKDIEE